MMCRACSPPPVSWACGSAGSRSKSGLLVVLVDDGGDFRFRHLRHERRDFIERVSGLMPFDDHVFEYFLHWYSFTVSQPMVVPWSVRQTHVTSPVLTVFMP